jgi:N-acetylmuramoyl-L-alanine amidase
LKIGINRSIWTAAAFALLAGASAPELRASGSPSMTTVGHHQYRRLKTVAADYDMKLAQLSPDALAIEKRNSSAIFYPGQRKLEFDGVAIHLNGDLAEAHGDWYLAEVDQRDIVDPLLAPAAHLKNHKCELVVLDPGHGGSDPGAVSPSGQMEKSLALDIARRVSDILRANNISVELTRDSDKDLQLGYRPRIAQNRAADIFVSIHLNAADNRAACGIETFRLTAPGFPSVEDASEAQFDSASYNGNGCNGANTILGYHIQKALLNVTGRPDRGLRHARFAVLKDAACPAVLVECGFLSNSEEERLLASPEYRAKLALGIADGIMRYSAAIGRAQLLEQPVAVSLPASEKKIRAKD